MRTVTTVTIISASDREGTFALVSKVTESADSALRHLSAMGEGRPEPVYVAGSAGWRWTWEFINEQGVRCSDTVRVF